VERIGISIIGAGVVGLAAAEAISSNYPQKDVLIFEKHEKFGQETSSRNSEVIHAGIYYPKDSLKSRLCIRGNKILYDFCREAGIKHKKCGKIIISTNEHEAEKIKSIYENAAANGVPELKLLTKEEVNSLEPEVFALNGIFSGSTGIVDSHGLMECLYQKARSNGGIFAFENEVKGVKRTKEGYLIRSNNEEILSEIVINCAGLFSDKIAEMAGLNIDLLGYRLHYCKGDYFSISSSKGKMAHLVYPVPHEKGYGLGVHATIDLAGSIRLGPDAHYIKTINYEVDGGKRGEFYNAARKYLPWLKEEALAPDMAGIRPKLQAEDEGFRDFVINEESSNGLPGFINMIGIESPGLTSALAIGKYVLELINDQP